MSNDTRSRPMPADTIHTCSYSCERPGCIRAQRDYLAARLTAETSNARGKVEYEYEVWQGAVLQAGGREADCASAQSEAGHYAAMYIPDGPVEVRIYEKRLISAYKAKPKRRRYDPSSSLSEYGIFPECDAQPPADDEVVFYDGVGAGRSSVKSCRDGVQWIMVGDRVYWPLSDSDAKRLQSACCGDGSFDGPATPAKEGEEIMVNTPYDVFILPLRPSGLDGKGPRFVVHVPGTEQPAAACEESSKGADVERPKRRPYNASCSLNELLLLNCGFPTKCA